MAVRHDILDRREPFPKPFVFSVGLHAVVFAAAVLYAVLPVSDVIRMGDANSLGGSAVSVTPVSRIPLPARSGRTNPLANDTNSRVPAAPEETPPQRREAVPDEEEAIPIKSPTPDRVKPRSSRRTATSPLTEPSENQVYSSSGAAAVSPMYGNTASGSGGVGIGAGNPFGNRFGFYVDLLRQRVGQAWDTGQVDPRLQTAPTVIVSFEILADGSIRNVRFLQRSGHSTLDYSCQRAIVEASPFPRLPPGFPRDVARIEFWFELKR